MRLTGESVSIAVLGALLTGVTQARLGDTVGSSAAVRATAKLLQGDLSGAVSAAGPGAGAGVAETAAASTDALYTALWAIVGVWLLGGVTVGQLARSGRQEASAATDDAARSAPAVDQSAPV